MDEIACAASGRATPRAMGCGVKAAPFMGAPFILDPFIIGAAPFIIDAPPFRIGVRCSLEKRTINAEAVAEAAAQVAAWEESDEAKALRSIVASGELDDCLGVLEGYGHYITPTAPSS